MKKLVFLWVISAGLLFNSCSTVPLTGRSRLNLVNNDAVMPMALQAYNQFLTENKKNVLSASNAQTLRVKTVGNKLIESVRTYMNANGHAELIKDFQWEINVVEDKSVNAWCMPGGKIVVYTGLLPVTQTDAGLAAVLGHEIGHAIAGHSAERMSQQLGSEIVNVVGNVALSNNQKGQAIFNGIYGVGGPLAMLSWSRSQELEADRMGLVFMAMAGYNPELAIDFWERMAKASEGSQKPMEFLSTHPSDATRIAQINKYLPEAKAYYKPK
ncbi:M48 family metallopeptidase [Pedobacter flavus]|uniref:M48 family metallopeptidase n=1 Tax=Pedobacter flavus TaxID=3113906 RepID=A0ABU7GXP8_9SPHI|nr:M48 family metallopeptidase [Pedobacter sp. VNH31]MEE1883835.1 M48 family metallopeptidase [Pedobacter sp. VNH31]